MSAASKKALMNKRSLFQKVSLSIRLLPEKAAQLRAVKNRSGAIAAFLSAHWEEFEVFLNEWGG